MGVLARVYSYLYHVILALLLLGISMVAILSHSNTLNLGMLPWKGSELTYWLLGAALFGLLSILLAWVGKLRGSRACLWRVRASWLRSLKRRVSCVRAMAAYRCTTPSKSSHGRASPNVAGHS